MNAVQDGSEQRSETIAPGSGNKAEIRREELRGRLLNAAEAQVAAGGLAGLKARDVTAAAGCALGALYTAFENLDELILYLSARTLARLDAALRAAAPDSLPPSARLATLAQAYVAFALSHRQLWAALFEHQLPPGVPVPDWQIAAQARLISQIAEPLAVLRPDLRAEALTLRSCTLFAAVHGVVELSLTGRFVGTPQETLLSEVTALVEALTRGIEAKM
jgi:AcrR family transcriptional regulator